ncbi:MAG: U32 family peptidase, partial [Polyangiaceae bacterium]
MSASNAGPQQDRERESVRRPEVLAPAGDEAAMKAAVLAGADAVYFGLSGFNARARAKNFDTAGLAKTMAYLHEHGVRGYVALNTLVFDEELGAAEAAVLACAEAGADAVIVQDLGMARLVRSIAPGMPIHASTQMTCTDAGSVELAREVGASRVILARELSIEEIAKIRAETDMELEVFVHGALCVAYSGQCLTSEAIGGRSANRGACAQACRLPYELLVDGELRDVGERAYLLSPEDLEASALVPELAKLGVTSLKIEGRLKGPEYVAATTRLYRSAVEKSGSLGELRSAALQMYTRGSGPGFLAGVNHQRLVEGRACDHRGLLAGEHLGVAKVGGRLSLRVKLAAEVARGDGLLVEGGLAGEGEIGGRVWGISLAGRDVERAPAGKEVAIWLGPDKRVDGARAGRRVWKTDAPALEKAVLAEVTERPSKVRVDVHVTGALGEPARFEARSEAGDSVVVECDADTVGASRGGELVSVLREKLGRLGETPFVLGEVTVELPEGAMIPPSAINRARRALVERLLAGARRSHATARVTAEEVLSAAVPPDRAPPPGGLFVLCRTLEQALAAAESGASGVYLDFLELTGTGEAVRALRAKGGAHITLAPPRIRKPGEEKIDRYLRDL